jgi:RHS repeat-associated protein
MNPVAYPGSFSPSTGSWQLQDETYTVPSSGVAYVRLYCEIYLATTSSVARFDDGFLSAGTTYYHGDQIGSARMISDAHGTAVWEGTFLPFGYEMNASSAENRFKFTGHERDGESGESGLDHTWFRQYASKTGRWLTPDPGGLAVVDPLNPQTWNRYAYVNNNPLNAADPWGLEPCQNGIDPVNGNICTTHSEGYHWWDDWPDVFQPTSFGGPGEYMNFATLEEWDAWVAGGTQKQKGTPRSQGSTSRLTCAANYGQNHSIAAAFGAQNSFAGNLFGGNTFSNLAYLGQSIFGSRTPTGGDIAGTILGGAGQGLPGGGPGFKGLPDRRATLSLAARSPQVTTPSLELEGRH